MSSQTLAYMLYQCILDRKICLSSLHVNSIHTGTNTASLGYVNSMVRFIIEDLGSNAYITGTYWSSFDPATFEAEVEFNENQSEIDVLEMEREFGLEGDSGDANVPEGQQKVVIKMADARTLDLFNGEKGDIMITGSGASRRIGYEGSVGALTGLKLVYIISVIQFFIL